MNTLKSYEIPIHKLENRRYEYQFSGDAAFFEAMEQTLVERGNFTAHVTLDKAETMLQLLFRIEGSYELRCDRSLDAFEEPFRTTQKLILKFGSEPQELSDEIEIIAWDTQSINIARYIFDFIGLMIPMKKLHPRFRTDATDDDEGNPEGQVVYTSKGDPEADDAPAAIDPRWQALQKLKNNGSTNGTR